MRDGVATLASLLPDDSQLTLWRFGTHLDGERDYEPVLRADDAATARAARPCRGRSGSSPRR